MGVLPRLTTVDDSRRRRATGGDIAEATGGDVGGDAPAHLLPGVGTAADSFARRGSTELMSDPSATLGAMGKRLSKSRFQKGLQCERALWLSVHEPESADPVSESLQWTFDQGTEVGRLAQGLFPGGVEVTEDHLHSEEAVATTARLLSEGVTALYEPAFIFDGVLVRVDALVAVDRGQWDLFEVKSTGSLKPEHVTDAAVQTYVVEGAGLPVRRSHVVHLDTSYAYEGGDYDLSRLFAVENVTADARAFMSSVPATLKRFRSMLEGPEPEVRVGTRCRNPCDCAFIGRCHAFMPAQYPITDIPRLSEKSLHALMDIGVTCILDVPDGFALSGNQTETVVVVKSGEPYVDAAGLAADLSALEWPVYHLDFETVNPALPLWADTTPYGVVPFQYSIHVHREDGTHEHREYLHVDGTDPRRPLAERMLDALGTRGSVTHYTAYETRILTGLAEALPDLADRIAAVKARQVDLEPVIKRNTKHPSACGRTSIKYVLPAWCPDMSYSDLGIRDGQTASIRYVKAVRGLVDREVAERTFADLVEYCGMDTLAMVRLLDRLREMVP